MGIVAIVVELDNEGTHAEAHEAYTERCCEAADDGREKGDGAHLAPGHGCGTFGIFGLDLGRELDDRGEARSRSIQAEVK